MKKIILYICLILSFNTNILAKNIDSLLQIVNKKEDTSKINLLIEISEEYNKIGNTKKCFKYAKNAYNLAKKINNPFFNAKSNFQIANSYIQLGKIDTAEIFYRKALNYYIKKNNRQKIAATYEKIGATYIYKSEYSKSIEYLNNALLINDSLINAYIFNDKGIIYSNLADYATALDYFMKSLKIVKKYTSKKRYMAGIYNNISTVYIYMNDNELALKYLKKAYKIIENTNFFSLKNSILNNIGNVFLNINLLDSAEYYFKTAYEVNKNLNNNEAKIINLINLANYSILVDNLDNALFFLNKSKKILENYNNTTSLVQYNIHKAKYYEKINKVDSSLLLLDNALKICIKNNLKELKLTVLNNYAKLLFQSNNYKKAYIFKSKYKKLSDSIFNLKKIQIIENLKAIHKIEQKEQEIKFLKLKTHKQKENLINIIVLSILSILLLSAFIYILVLKNKNTKQQLAIINEQNTLKELELQKKNIENQKISLELENKQKEIFIKINQIIQTNELIKQINKKLKFISKNVSPENQKVKKEIQKLLIQIKTQDRKQLWKEFETRFQNVHKEFYNNLLKKYPELTPNERKLCAFLKLNLSTKDIASITLQSQNAIFVARNRLRKKLDIDNDENLIAFIQSL